MKIVIQRNSAHLCKVLGHTANESFSRKTCGVRRYFAQFGKAISYKGLTDFAWTESLLYLRHIQQRAEQKKSLANGEQSKDKRGHNDTNELHQATSHIFAGPDGITGQRTRGAYDTAPSER